MQERRHRIRNLKNNARNIDTALAQYRIDSANGNLYPSSWFVWDDIKTPLQVPLASYFAPGVNSSVWSHPNTAAKYVTNRVTNTPCPVSAYCYMQQWDLESRSDNAYPGPTFNINGLGNGVYSMCIANGVPYQYTSSGSDVYGCDTIQGKAGPIIKSLNMITLSIKANKVFITYGPQ